MMPFKPDEDDEDWADQLDESILTSSDLLPDDYEAEEPLGEDTEDLPLAPVRAPLPVNLPVPVPSAEMAPPPAEQKHPLQARRPTSNDTEKFIDFNKVFQSLDVKWDAKAPYRVLASTRKRALLIGWSQEDLLSVERSIGIYSAVPRYCPGPEQRDPTTGTLIKSGCPCEKRYGADPKVWNGVRCPGETMRVYQLLVQYVRDLGIEPTDHVDLQQVSDIIRLQIQIERCDQRIQDIDEGLLELQFVAIARDGTVHRDKAVAPVLTLQKTLRADRDKLYKDLVATRHARNKNGKAAAVAAGGLAAAVAMGDMVQILSNARKTTLAKQQSELINHAHPDAIEAEFEDDIDA